MWPESRVHRRFANLVSSGRSKGEIERKKSYSGTRRYMDGQEGPGVLQIECITTFWCRNEAATPTTLSGRRDRAVLVR